MAFSGFYGSNDISTLKDFYRLSNSSAILLFAHLSSTLTLRKLVPTVSCPLPQCQSAENSNLLACPRCL